MRLPARFVLSGAAAIVLSSCYGERAVSPAEIPTVSGSPILRSLAVATDIDFVVPATGASIDLAGAYALEFPAGSICDPNAADTQTGYANQDWDASCTPASGDVSVHATLKYADGVLYADFSPALRFVPSKQVILSTNVLAPVVQYFDSTGVNKGWAIGYTPAIAAPLQLDALADPSLRTVVVGSTGKVFRRIKHFSGYSVATGDGYVPCDPNDGDPLCVWHDDDA